jgi:hypothetical protein
MAAPFRIYRPSIIKVADDSSGAVKEYLERLIKLIPGEVISLYLVGKGVISSGNDAQTPLGYWIFWTAFSLGAVLLVRIFGTADPKEGESAQIPAVLISCVSFLVWIYSMGDLFKLLNVYEPKLASLMVLGWSFVVPYFYKGDRSGSSRA